MANNPGRVKPGPPADGRLKKRGTVAEPPKPKPKRVPGNPPSPHPGKK